MYSTKSTVKGHKYPIPVHVFLNTHPYIDSPPEPTPDGSPV